MRLPTVFLVALVGGAANAQTNAVTDSASELIYLSSSATMTSSATGRPLSPTCGIERCIPGGLFFGCTVSDFPCICTKERRFVDDYINLVSPCIKDQHGCTPGGIYTFMDAFQYICAYWGNPLTSLPSDIETWLMSRYATMPASTHTAVASTIVSITASEGRPSTVFPLPSSAPPTATSTGTYPLSSSRLSTGAKIGISLGSVCAASLLVGILAVAYKRRKAGPRFDDQTPDIGNAEAHQPAMRDSIPVSELEGSAGVYKDDVEKEKEKATRQSVPVSELEGDVGFERAAV